MRKSPSTYPLNFQFSDYNHIHTPPVSFNGTIKPKEY